MKTKENDIFDDGHKLPLIDQFYTVQGEAFHTGRAAYFIRIGGCDIGCRWCDTKISWNFNTHKLVDIEEVVSNIKKENADTIVVTGGEPTLYNLEPLCNLLKQNSIKTHIETSGAYKLTGNWDWICLSPKKQSPPKEEIYKLANELKVIIFDEDDYRWAEEVAEKVNKDCKLYLQPEWSKHNLLTPEIVEYVKKNKKWQISIQAHKFMKIP
ncbi:MAG: 7-carboxy-7-deazaguanine synthase QueE [Bacteroidales bacterium]|nr:7-carboxy-7-deazaguanine synthase QueE [Bacteroidales bacterium]MBN2757590.1 7-carboxy-7-deazaguanine synthase QueE [Bacteroidales bacterium]